MPLTLIVQAGGGGALGGMVLFLPLVLLIFYMFYSQQRRTKKWQGMLDQLKAGDKVTTSGGLRGTIMALKDDCHSFARSAEQSGRGSNQGLGDAGEHDRGRSKD